jgi:hypothetical protein
MQKLLFCGLPTLTRSRQTVEVAHIFIAKATGVARHRLAIFEAESKSHQIQLTATLFQNLGGPSGEPHSHKL